MKQPAAILIGRNEGARLVACLASLTASTGRVIYVDSGSDDGSVEVARQTGAEVVQLDTGHPFTAARARNAGFAQLLSGEVPEFVQFIDGDCALRDGWIDTAEAFLNATPKAAVACGRRRERHPEASIYNALIDAEWDTAIGQARSCGGDALMRVAALRAVGGYNDTLIAGEEPELCVRLRAAGWQVWRLEAEMTWHDAAMTRFGQWFKRARRAGHAYAEGAALHGKPPERHNVAQTRRALIWGAALPVFVLIGMLVSGWFGLLFLIYPAQVARLARTGMRWTRAAFLTLGKFPEALGVLEYHWRRRLGARAKIIEYK